MSGFVEGMMVTLLVVVCIAIVLSKVGKGVREREVGEKVNIKDMTMAMVKVFDLEDNLIQELPVYMHVAAESDIKTSMAEWSARIHLAGYSQAAPHLGYTIVWPPHMLGPIQWRVQSYGKGITDGQLD